MAAIFRATATSAANAIGTASSVDYDGTQQLLGVTVAYSGSPTQAGVTVTLNNGAGAGYDCLLTTGTANARYTTYLPSAPLFIAADDAIDVSAPAGGVGVTSSIAVYTRPA